MGESVDQGRKVRNDMKERTDQGKKGQQTYWRQDSYKYARKLQGRIFGNLGAGAAPNRRGYLDI